MDTLCRYRHHLSTATARQTHESKNKIHPKAVHPPSLLAGFIGLSLGPHGFGIIPLSTQTGTYAGILIAFIFGALPLISQKAAKGDADNIGSMWAYSQAGMLLQWAFGGLLGLLVLNRIWPLNPAFGITMPSGYCGGHGTAAAIGQAFSQFGYDEILTLAMTAATFGIVAAVIIGLIIINGDKERAHLLPRQLR